MAATVVCNDNDTGFQLCVTEVSDTKLKRNQKKSRPGEILQKSLLVYCAISTQEIRLLNKHLATKRVRMCLCAARPFCVRPPGSVSGLLLS